MLGKKNWQIICSDCRNVITDRDKLIKKYSGDPCGTSLLIALNDGTNIYKCEKCSEISCIGYVCSERRKKFKNFILFIKDLPLIIYRIITGLYKLILEKYNK